MRWIDEFLPFFAKDLRSKLVIFDEPQKSCVREIRAIGHCLQTKRAQPNFYLPHFMRNTINVAALQTAADEQLLSGGV